MHTNIEQQHSVAVCIHPGPGNPPLLPHLTLASVKD